MKKIQLVSFLFAVLVAIFIVVWFGAFNFSAKDKHWKITTTLLEFIKERSITVRVNDISVPDLSSLDMISNGAKNFDAMCAQCHLAPTMKPTELSLGLYPQPPIFYKNKHSHHGAANTFWSIKNGLKMTGMPAWGDFHSDEQIWEMVAFLEKINGISVSEYTQLVGDGGHTHKENEEHQKTDNTLNSKDNHHE